MVTASPASASGVVSLCFNIHEGDVLALTQHQIKTKSLS